jgi:NTP pyrophosphatase (non-canonical NTP hydrolase)
MNFEQFQSNAKETDETAEITVALYGLVGEVGSIFSVFKKNEREKLPSEEFRRQLSEEMGDVLWYLSNLATLNGIALSDVASENLEKAESLFSPGGDGFYDAVAPFDQQLPRRAEFEFVVSPDGLTSTLLYENEALGDPIRDNSPEEDYYRFHDVFHIAYAAVLGWSPNLRKLLRRKRKYDALIDENEDGARACIVEEAIAAICFEVSEDHGGFRTPQSVPFSLLKTITRLVKKYEVKAATRKQWQSAIFYGFKVHRQLIDANGGLVVVDMDQRRIEFRPRL